MKNTILNKFQTKTNGLFIRNSEAVDLLELFFISSVTSFIFIRGYLKITGFPQLGGGNIHVAHLLWGGLFMLIALLLTFVSLSNNSKKMAAIIGGIGFGTFIDEVGKFLTSNNDYFFQPSIAIIYVVFVCIFILIKVFQNYSRFSSDSIKINAIHYLPDIVLKKLNSEKRNEILKLLENLNQTDPMTKNIEQIFKNAEYKSYSPNEINETIKKVKKLIIKVINSRGIQAIVLTILFLGILFTFFLSAVALYGKIFNYITVSYLISAIISSLFALAGYYFLFKNRQIKAYQFFIISVLISIFISQFFLFLQNQLATLNFLLINLVIYTFFKIKYNSLILKEN